MISIEIFDQLTSKLIQFNFNFIVTIQLILLNLLLLTLLRVIILLSNVIVFDEMFLSSSIKWTNFTKFILT